MSGLHDSIRSHSYNSFEVLSRQISQQVHKQIVCPLFYSAGIKSGVRYEKILALKSAVKYKFIQ